MVSLSECEPRPGWQGAAGASFSPLLRLVDEATIEAARRSALGCLANGDASVWADRQAAVAPAARLRRGRGT